MTDVAAGLRSERERFRRYWSVFERQLRRLERGRSMHHHFLDAVTEYFETYLDAARVTVVEAFPEAADDHAVDAALTRWSAARGDLQRSVNGFSARVEHMRLGHDISRDMLLTNGRDCLAASERYLEKEATLMVLAAQRDPAAWADARGEPSMTPLEPALDVSLAQD